MLPRLVISELRTRGPNGASDEFIEIYNNSDVAIPMSGLKIRGSSSTGGITTRLTVSANTVIPPRGHFLAINSSGYSGNIAGDQSFTSGFANDGGVALTTSDNTIIDQVGLSNGSAFKEGNHLTPLTTDANQSYERKPGGPEGSTQDTQDNAADFNLVTSDPQNLLSNPTPDASPSPSPSPSPTISPSPSPSPTPSTNQGLVISQVFGGGGNSGAPFRNDFIEIFNGGITSVSLSGWSVQYASSTASVWSVTNLNDVTLAPGQYYLVQQAGGSNGQPLPTPDAVGTISLAATAGKVALVKTTTPLSGACPNNVSIRDLVGYGSTATCFEGSAAAPGPGNTTAIIRKSDGCVDTNNNQSDFVTAPPLPRNTGIALNTCADPPQSALMDASIYLFFWSLLHGSFW